MVKLKQTIELITNAFDFLNLNVYYYILLLIYKYITSGILLISSE